jgi:rhomboid protease GluP
MQHFSEVLSFEGYSPAQFTLLLKLALERLQWQVSFNDKGEVVARVPASEWSWGEVISIQVYEQEALIVSKYVQWTLPLSNKNKQNVQALNNAIGFLQKRYDAGQLEAILPTLEIAMDVAIERPKAFTRGHYVMYGMGISMIAVFVIMVCSGVSLFAPDVDAVVSWGGNFWPLVMSGDYWRLFTCLFVHVGVLHLLLNLSALYVIGLHLEPLIGRWRFLLCFLLTGLAASTVSIWNNSSAVSAGASGAIFGLYGVFMSLLTTGVAGKKLRASLLGSMGLFVLVNLLYGLKDDVDNAAHMGGLVSGLVIGLLLAGEWKWMRLHLVFRTVAFMLPLLVTVPYLVRNQHKPEATRPAREVALVGRIQEMVTLDEEASWPIVSGSGKSDNQLAGEIERVSIPKWTEMSNILAGYNNTPLDSFNRKLHAVLTDYTQLRLKESALYIQKADDSLNFSPGELASIQSQVKSKQAAFLEIKW